MNHVAVIGAGITGLTVATDLAAAGHEVSLFDKSRGPGGRCATRRSTVGAFDHGAPGFSATTAAFRAQVAAWRTAAWHAAAHRWRYAQVRAPRKEPFGWNVALRLGSCGDAWHARGDPGSTAPDGIERAWLSGRALAQQMHRTLSPG